MSNQQFARRLELIEAEKDLNTLIESQLVPPLMLAKLQFLMSLIETDRVRESTIQLLPYYQRQVLEELPPQTQISLFISIVRCLAGKEIIFYFRGQKAYMRKQKTFFGWKKCYIDCSSKEILLFESRKTDEAFQRLEIANLWISRSYKYYKKKSIFAVYYQAAKYVFGFDEEITCKRVHQTLTSLICEKKEWQCTKYSKLDLLKEINPPKLGPESRKVEQAIMNQEQEYLSSLQQKLNKLSFADKNFKLFKNIENGRILISEDTGEIKVNLILRQSNIISLLQTFLAQTVWNNSVQTFSILGKPRQNSYLAYMKTNKYNLISYTRDCFLSIVFYRSCECRSKENVGSSYLIIESIENDSQPPATGVIRMNFNQMIEICKSKEESNVVLMSIVTKADFKGYSSIADNIAMSIHLLSSITLFVKEMDKPQKKPSLFEEIVCPCKNEASQSERIISDFSVPTEQNLSNDDQLSQKPIAARNFLKQGSKNINEVVLSLQALLKGVKNEQILDILIKKQHQSYALKHYFTSEDEAIRTYVGDNKEYLQQGNKWRLKGDTFIFVDQQALAAQKDILKMIIKQLGTNIMAGKSVMNMSLPVEIFDKKSMLDVIAESFGFLPYYLSKAVSQSNPIQQIKYITCAFMFISATSPNIQKPFNPILGETYQGKLGSYIVQIEQISHHPPISAVYIKSKDIQFYGNFEVTVDVGITSAYSKITSWFNLNILSQNAHYKIKVPDLELGGLMYGDRTLKLAHKCYIYEKNNNLFCEVSIGKDKKRVYETTQKLGPADLSGGIFRVSGEFGDKVLAQTGKKVFDGLRPQDIVESMCFLTGKWYGNLLFDGKSYKSIIDGPYPQKCFKLKYLLPSDSIFRQDVIFKIWKDNDGSNRQKEKLQNLQRNDRKLRQKFNKK